MREFKIVSTHAYSTQLLLHNTFNITKFTLFYYPILGFYDTHTIP
jgi:hypothetical protein